MSATKSASTGMPYLKPKLTIVTFRLRAAGDPKCSAIRAVQLVHVERRGVDHEVGAAPDLLEHGALPRQPVDQPAAALQRVRTAYGLLPPDQHVVAGVQVEQRGRPPRRVLVPVGGERR